MVLQPPGDCKPNPADALDYLRVLWPEPAPTGFLSLTDRDFKRVRWFRTDDLEGLAAAAAGTTNAFLSVALSGEDFGPHERCKAAQAVAIPGAWADIDVGTAGHARTTGLPGDLAEGTALAFAMPLRPSLLVRSGHGLYPWWLFHEPWVFETDAERERAAALVRAWQQLLAARARERDYALDMTADFARVLRVPGGVNRKPGCGPVAVSASLAGPIPRYDPAELEAALPPPAPRPPTPASRPAGTVRRDGEGRVSADELVRRALQRVQPGQADGRNGTGVWLACQLRDNGFLPVEAAAAMASYAAAVPPGEHPYLEREWRDSLKQAYSRPPREPWRRRAAGAFTGRRPARRHVILTSSTGGE